MSPKLQKVCNHYLQGMSMRQALLAVGYSDGYASHNSSKFLHNREVQRYIRARQKDEAESALADATFVKKKLMDLASDQNPNVALNALKQLDAHNEWMKSLDSKLKSLEVAKESPNQPIININIPKITEDN